MLRRAESCWSFGRTTRLASAHSTCLKWGLIPHWCNDPKGGRKPINAKAESVSKLPMFRDAYALRRCIVPVDGFFEWRAIRGARTKQPYAIAMKDGSPFAFSGAVGELEEPEDR